MHAILLSSTIKYQCLPLYYHQGLVHKSTPICCYWSMKKVDCCAPFGGIITSSFAFDMVDCRYNHDIGAFKEPNTSNLQSTPIMCKKDLPLETCRPQNGRNRVDGVENGRFYITDGDDSCIITEAAASDCRLRRIGNNIGVHFSTVELAYWMVVGNCGHSIRRPSWSGCK